MPDRSHFQRLRPIVSALAAQGVPVSVFTDQQFQADVELAGGTFVDLFTRYSLESADAESMPMPSRLVTYAGKYADRIATELRAVNASLVLHDTFAVAGWVAADLADIPRVLGYVKRNLSKYPELTQLHRDLARYVAELQ